MTWSSVIAPLRGRSVHAPASSKRAQVDDRRGRAGQLAAVEHEVGLARIASGTSSSRRASGPPARFALDWSTGQRTASSAATAGGSAGTRRPSVVGSAAHASGNRRAGLGSSSVSRPGQQRLDRRARPLAELGQRGQRELDGEEHHRGGLVGPPALQRV